MSEQVTPTTPVTTQVDGNTTAETSPAASTTAQTESKETLEKGAAEVTPADKPKEETAETPDKVVPEKYELALSAESKLDPARLQEIEAEAREGKLTNDEAQKLVAREEKAVATYEAREAAAYEERKAKWVDEIKADKEFGGENAAKTAETAHRFIERYATPGFKEVLESTGLGNHPGLVMTLARAAKDLGESEMVIPGAHGAAEESPASVLYPKKK